MEPAERIGSGRTLGKRPRSRVLSRTASMVTVPSAAKQGRQERGAGGVPASCSLPDSGAGMGTGGGGAAPRGFFSGGYLAGAETTTAFLMACGLGNRRSVSSLPHLACLAARCSCRSPATPRVV